VSTAATGTAFFLAVTVILLACRAVSQVVARLGQPPVVGEMIAGVLLGPSLLGLVWPAAQAVLFPDAIRPLLYVGGQIGLVIYMFGVGHEFSLREVRGSARTAGAISITGSVAPLVLGIGVGVLGTGWAGVTALGVSPVVSVGFIGVALAITAFPMMARIISERRLAGTRFGSIALACGALDDVLAWTLLAVVVSLRANSAAPVALAVGGGVVLVALLWLVGRRWLGSLLRSARLDMDKRVLVTVLLLFAAAWYTDMIGLYAVFGAFCFGVCFPRGEVADAVVAKLMPVGRIVFLPLFFVYSGLNSRFALLAQPTLLAFAVLCVAVAVVGKLGACWAAARLVGEPQPIAVRIGVLINARGLMQLIALNVGLQAGIVSPALFTVLVVVALVTTVMTAPLLSWLDRRDAHRGSTEVDQFLMAAKTSAN
jgi:Kef-type K+ transport system membrane component KefB